MDDDIEWEFEEVKGAITAFLESQSGNYGHRLEIGGGGKGDTASSKCDKRKNIITFWRELSTYNLYRSSRPSYSSSGPDSSTCS